MTDTVLVLGTNAGQADLIRHMKARGWHVAACAHLSGLPGEALADRFDLVDIRDVDAVASLARQVGADIVYSISSDLAMKSAVQVSEQLGLPHFFNSDIIDLFDKKHRLRAHLNDCGLSVVPHARVDKDNPDFAWTQFPCVVKPADAQGQRGLAIAADHGQMTDAVRSAIAQSPSGTAVVEPFLEGTEVSSNVLVHKGEIIVNEVSERLVHSGELYGIPRGHLVPGYNVPDEAAEAVRSLVRAVVASLELQNGCLYFQMKLTADGPKIIEIAPRLDGCHMWRLIYHARNIDFLASTIDVLLGQAPDLSGYLTQRNIHELMFQQAPPASAFAKADFPVPADTLYHEYRYDEGEAVQAINGKMDVVGYYVRAVPDSEVQKFEADRS